jgi:hypothetical protein
VIEQIGRLAHERVVVFGDAGQCGFDAFLAQLLGDLERALGKEFCRVRRLGISAFARPDHVEEPVDGMDLSHSSLPELSTKALNLSAMTRKCGRAGRKIRFNAEGAEDAQWTQWDRGRADNTTRVARSKISQETVRQ